MGIPRGHAGEAPPRLSQTAAADQAANKADDKAGSLWQDRTVTAKRARGADRPGQFGPLRGPDTSRPTPAPPVKDETMPAPKLSAAHPQQVQAWLTEFHRTWSEGSLPDWVQQLPPPGSPP